MNDSAGIASIQPRALKKQPLDEPRSDESFADFIDRISKYSDDEIPIQPGDDQLSSWQVSYAARRAPVPVGATALAYRFEDEKQTRWMGRLTGCTAVIAIVSCMVL